jgi:hypothetical protein
MPSADYHTHNYLSKSLEKVVIKKALRLSNFIDDHFLPLLFGEETPATP